MSKDYFDISKMTNDDEVRNISKTEDETRIKSKTEDVQNPCATDLKRRILQSSSQYKGRLLRR